MRVILKFEHTHPHTHKHTDIQPKIGISPNIFLVYFGWWEGGGWWGGGGWWVALIFIYSLNTYIIQQRMIGMCCIRLSIT